MQNRSLGEFLTSGFKTAAQKKAYQAKTQDWLRKQQYTRVFNAHVSPVIPADLEKAKKLFFHYPLFGSPELRQVTTVVDSEHEHHFEFSRSKDKERVLSLIKIIVARACQELLDSHGHIKRQLVHLLDWGDFHSVIRDKLNVAGIVRSYVEVIFGGLLQAVIDDTPSPEHLLPLMGSITRIANDHYASVIQQTLHNSIQVDVLDDFAKKFVAALPRSISGFNVRLLILQDLDLSRACPLLYKDYSTFWVHVLTECLAAKRFDMLAVLSEELPKYIKLSSLHVDLQAEYLFCHGAAKQLDKSLLASAAATSSDNRAVIKPMRKVLATRDHYVTMSSIIAEYIKINPRERIFIESDILTRVDQGVAVKNGVPATLLERLQFAYKECQMYRLPNKGFTKIIAKHVAFHAARTDAFELKHADMLEQKAERISTHSAAVTLQQLGLLKTRPNATLSPGETTEPPAPQSQAIGRQQKK